MRDARERERGQKYPKQNHRYFPALCVIVSTLVVHIRSYSLLP